MSVLALKLLPVPRTSSQTRACLSVIFTDVQVHASGLLSRSELTRFNKRTHGPRAERSGFLEGSVARIFSFKTQRKQANGCVMIDTKKGVFYSVRSGVAVGLCGPAGLEGLSEAKNRHRHIHTSKHPTARKAPVSGCGHVPPT